MNQMLPIKADWQEAQAERRARYAAAVTRMAKLAIEWADRPDDDLAKLAFLDVLGFCIDSDLGEEADKLRRDLGLTEDGFPADDYGFAVPGAERRVVLGMVR